MNDFRLVIAAALLPAVVLMYYIYRRDKYQPEPTSELVKGFFWGVLSAFLSLCLSGPLTVLGAGLGIKGEGNLLGCFYTSFCLAAIPEELAKAFCLYFFLRRNKYFDEYMDGIVYAVAVGMGFAGLENVCYLFMYHEVWMGLGITRGLLSVPGHFAFAVLMGYFFALWRMGGGKRNFWLMLVAPILAHGIYDLLCFSKGIVPPAVGLLLFVAIAVFLYVFLRKRCLRYIEAHLAEDKLRMERQEAASAE